MNQKTVLTKEKVTEVANFLKRACEYFKKDEDGCWTFNLDDNFVIAVGWLDGYDMADSDIIKSAQGRVFRENRTSDHDWVCGYAVNAGVKIRNDSDCWDYQYMNMPIYNDDSGDVWDTDVTMLQDMTDKDYKFEAKYFLKSYVAMVNALEHNKIKIDF